MTEYTLYEVEAKDGTRRNYKTAEKAIAGFNAETDRFIYAVKYRTDPIVLAPFPAHKKKAIESRRIYG